MTAHDPGHGGTPCVLARSRAEGVSVEVAGGTRDMCVDTGAVGLQTEQEPTLHDAKGWAGEGALAGWLEG